MEELVGDVAGLIDHCGREQAHVVGHDWGGIVPWEMGSRRPDIVDRLVVLNAPHIGQYREVVAEYPEQRKRSWYAAFFQLPWLPEKLLGAFECAGLWKLVEGNSHHDTFGAAEARRYREVASRPGALTAAISYYRKVFRDAVREEISALFGGERPSRTVNVPTQIIWGEQDTALLREQAEGMDQWVPDLRIEYFSDASHFVHMDEPEAVNETLVEFLGE